MLGVFLIFTGFLIFVAFNVHYGLWRRRFTKRDKLNKSNNRSDRYLVDE